MRHLHPRMTSNRQGSALLTVLWLTAALSAIGLAVANNVRGETERAATSVDELKAYFIARGAVERAALRIRWGADFYQRGQPVMELPFPNAQVRVEIIPESSKLSLNTAAPQELLRLLIALGVPEDKALEMSAAIVDWRSPVTPERPSSFDPFYLAQPPSFPARHSSFQESEELLQVKGITPDLYYGTSLDNRRAGLRDCLSPFAGGGYLDINTVRAETMIAIGIAPQDAEAIVKHRAERPILDYKELQEMQQTLGPAGFRLGIGGITMFTLRATAQLKQPDGKLSDMHRTVAALVKFLGGNSEVVRWYDRI